MQLNRPIKSKIQGKIKICGEGGTSNPSEGGENVPSNEQQTSVNNEQKDNETAEANESEKIEDREKFKEEYEERLKELIKDNPTLLELAKEISMPLGEARNKFGASTDVRVGLEEKIKSLFNNEGMDSAKNYVNSLGDTPEGIYAGEYLKYVDRLNDLSDANDMGMNNLINSGESNGTITQEEAKRLRENTATVLTRWRG